MELKTYQKKVIADLARYMELLGKSRDINTAWKDFWTEKEIPVGYGGVPYYQNILPGTPNLCMKVPTGGGKTFLACNAIKPIFDGLPDSKIHAVVWLVPSDAILTQTLAALKSPNHPYRQKINSDFGSRVEVYTKQELLNGQNFNITTVTEQLSIMVLSYDSFRGRKEMLKAKQENSNLASMAKALGAPQNPIEDADETALIQIINQLSPLVIVDESHHARSNLSKEMLKNFNPCFVLDLTATPTKESNILCYVDAVQLKRENMVKLPVIVYNRDSQQEVMSDAIDLRSRLEEYAQTEQTANGFYIRPIVLFQAQPKGKEDSTTFEKLRDKLVLAGIPSEQIAIKTAEVNELKSIDLMRQDCPIRYIITVNALKEGWDCPFAYVLASLANKTSQVDVEQIVGRVLRQPHTRRYANPALNMSFVLTSSNDFKTTLDGIVRGLNGAGFSDKDYRVAEDAPAAQAPAPEQHSEQLRIHPTDNHPETSAENSPEEEFLDFDPAALGQAIQQREESKDNTDTLTGVSSLLEETQKAQDAFDATLTSGTDKVFADIPTEVQDKMSTFYMNAEFEGEAKAIRIPQFFRKIDYSLIIGGDMAFLKKETLGETFTLKGKPYQIDFTRADDEMARVDINDKEGRTPKAFQMSEADQRFVKEQFSKYSPEQKIQTCKHTMHKLLNRMNNIDSSELEEYLDRIVDDMDRDTLSALEKSPHGFALTIKNHIEGLLDAHYEKQFGEWVETGEIICKPSYELPPVIAPVRATTTFGKSLYQGEEDGNDFEYSLIMALTGLPNVKWWHRNMSKHGFWINGFVNHYPDFIIRTVSGHTVLVETKGDHLDNEENRKKLAEGRVWQEKANQGTDEYRYYMVFQNKQPDLKGAYSKEKFLELMKKL